MENYLDFKNNNIDYMALYKPANILKNGGIVIFPTETVYGIGANCLDEHAIQKLYEIKNRPFDKPISVLVSNMNMINTIAKDITPLEYKLMENFFPGPLTLILHKNDIIPNIVTSNKNTIGIRMPNNSIALNLIKYTNIPIATSSANISGKCANTNLKYLIKDFNKQVNYFIDNGESKIGVVSTVVKVINNVPHILREGAISKEQIYKVTENSL